MRRTLPKAHGRFDHPCVPWRYCLELENATRTQFQSGLSPSILRIYLRSPISASAEDRTRSASRLDLFIESNQPGRTTDE